MELRLPCGAEARKGCAAVVHTGKRDDSPTLLLGREEERVRSYLDELSAPIADGRELNALFEGWSIITGPLYAGLLAHGYCGEDAEPYASAHILNDFSCEARAPFKDSVPATI